MTTSRGRRGSLRTSSPTSRGEKTSSLRRTRDLNQSWRENSQNLQLPDKNWILVLAQVFLSAKTLKWGLKASLQVTLNSNWNSRCKTWISIAIQATRGTETRQARILQQSLSIRTSRAIQGPISRALTSHRPRQTFLSPTLRATSWKIVSGSLPRSARG